MTKAKTMSKDNELRTKETIGKMLGFLDAVSTFGSGAVNTNNITNINHHHIGSSLQCKQVLVNIAHRCQVGTSFFIDNALGPI